MNQIRVANVLEKRQILSLHSTLLAGEIVIFTVYNNNYNNDIVKTLRSSVQGGRTVLGTTRWANVNCTSANGTEIPHKPMNPNKPCFTDYEAKQTFYTEYSSVFVRSK